MLGTGFRGEGARCWKDGEYDTGNWRSWCRAKAALPESPCTPALAETFSWYRMGTLTILCAAWACAWTWAWATWAMLAASSSAAICRFHLFLRFWNQILTWVSVRCREAASPARSELERYRFMSNVVSNWNTWLRENTVRVFFFFFLWLRSPPSPLDFIPLSLSTSLPRSSSSGLCALLGDWERLLDLGEWIGEVWGRWKPVMVLRGVAGVTLHL